MALLTSHQAMQLTATFAFTAERMRAGTPESHARARVCEAASRIAFLRASILARDEETRPEFGGGVRKAVFAVA